MLNGPDLVVNYLRAVLAENGKYPTSRIYFREPYATTQALTLGSTYAGDHLNVAPLTTESYTNVGVLTRKLYPSHCSSIAKPKDSLASPFH